MDEEVDIFDRIEAADVAEDAGACGPGALGGRNGRGIGEAIDVDAVGDDDAFSEVAVEGDAIEDGLGGNDEGIGARGEEALEGPVPARARLERMDGLYKLWAILKEGQGEGAEEVGVDKYGVEDMWRCLVEEADEAREGAGEAEGGREVEGGDL